MGAAVRHPQRAAQGGFGLELFDYEFLIRYPNAPWLVIQNPGHKDNGLFLRDEHGNPPRIDKADSWEALLSAHGLITW